MNIALRLYKKLKQGSRLNIYENIIKLAIDNGYKVLTIYDWHITNKTDKVLILRHDVDIDVEGARKMFEIEKRLGVNSSYYFRNSTKEASLIKDMQNNGFETGLHYETLADYCKIKGIQKSSDLKEVDYSVCKKILQEEIKSWKLQYGDLYSICAHGDKRNRQLHIANRVLFDEAVRKNTSVHFDACDKDLTGLVDVYISDTSVINNHKWKEGVSPEEAINRGEKTIMLLTHPTHWNYNIIKNIKSLYRAFKENTLNHVYNKRRFV